MPRATMSNLIARLRRMVGDLAVTPNFSDDAIQDTLDGWQTSVVYELLTPAHTNTGGMVQYKTFGSAYRHFEDGVVLSDANYTTLTPATSNLISGIFTFATDQGTTVYLSGNTYDVNGAAADLCDAWAASLSRSFDVVDGESGMKRSQMAKSLREQAKQYRQSQGIVQTPSTRTDVSTAHYDYPDWRNN